MKKRAKKIKQIIAKKKKTAAEKKIFYEESASTLTEWEWEQIEKDEEEFKTKHL